MPQANITYNTAYNRDLVSRIKELDEDMLWHNRHQYHPSPMGYRMSGFHDAQGISNTPNIGRDYSRSCSGTGTMTGGGANRKFILNGNSPAYPPANMKAALAVYKGNSRGTMAEVDGAVGGSFYKDFKKGFDGVMDTGKKVAETVSTIAPVAALAAKAMSGSGTTTRRVGRKQTGGNIFKSLASLAKKIAPSALKLLTGLGRKASMTDKRKACADAISGGNFWDTFKKDYKDIADLAKKVAPIALPLMTGLGKKQYGGSFNFGKFLGKVAKAAAPVAIKEGKKALGLGKVSKVGGNVLDDAIEATKPLVRKGKAAIQKAVKENAPKVIKAAEKAVTKAVTGGGRATRAAIVKKVMKERGVKMIQASQIVKAEGLYKK